MHNTERKLQKRRTDFGAFFFSTQLVCPFIFSPIQGGRKQRKKRRQIYFIFVFSFLQSHPKAGFVNRKKADYIYIFIMLTTPVIVTYHTVYKHLSTEHFPLRKCISFCDTCHFSQAICTLKHSVYCFSSSTDLHAELQKLSNIVSSWLQI